MYIGKVLLGNTWATLESLIKEQVSGQSTFAFDKQKEYQFQGEGVGLVRLCDTTDTPSASNDGFCIEGTQIENYTPSDGDLYVRADLTQKTGNPNYGKMYLKIREVDK